MCVHALIPLGTAAPSEQRRASMVTHDSCGGPGRPTSKIERLSTKKGGSCCQPHTPELIMLHGEMARAVARVHKHGTSPGAQEPDSRRARWVSDPIKAQRNVELLNVNEEIFC